MTDIDEEGFDPALLKEPTERRYEYYKLRTVAHPILENAYETIMSIIREPAGKQIVMVIGPPRSGKTFLLEWLEADLKYAWAKIQASDPGRIPIASIEVPSRDTLKPNWALAALKQGLEALLDTEEVLSVTEVARRMGCGVRTLHRLFPDLCARISRRNAAFVSSRARERLQKLYLDISQAATQLYADNINPTLRNVSRFLNRPEYAFRSDASAALREARLHLH